MEAGARTGEVIRGYRLDRLIAEGGMGAVWSATHTSLGRRAAVKLLAPQLAANKEYVSRFLSEARIVNDVRHPNIVDIFDFVESESPPRVACIMELLEGPTLAKVVRGRPLSGPQALRATLQLVDALLEVHAAGVIHRDLKPQNIIVVAPVESDLSIVPSVKILDFGIAKQDSAQAHKTQTGSIMGTPAYMAPEQVAAAEVSSATDLYALAEILFEMVTGRRLFQGDNLQILRQKMQREVPNLTIGDHIRDADRIVALLRPCLAPDPAARPDMRDFGAALRMLLDEWGESYTQDATLPTMPDQDAPTHPGPEPTVPSPASLDLEDDEDEPPANTQMFYDQILEDLGELQAELPSEPEPADTESEPEPELTLAAPSPRQGYGVLPEQAPRPRAQPSFRPAEERRRPAPSMVPVVQGRKTTRLRWWWPVIGLVILVGIAGAVLLPDLRNQARAQIELLRDAPEATDVTGAWKDEIGEIEGSLDEHLGWAEQAHLLDTPAGYADARTHLRIALILAPDDPRAIGAYVENEVVGYLEVLEPSERGELLDWLDRMARQTPAADRALAALSTRPGERRQRVQSLLQSSHDQDRLAGADLLRDEDPQRALDAIADVTGPPRSYRVRARALMALGRWTEAAEQIDAGREAVKQDGLLWALQAELHEAVGELPAAERAWQRAVDGGALGPAILAHGRAAMALGDIAQAAERMSAVANDERWPTKLRAQAYSLWAQLALQQSAWPVAAQRAAKALDLDRAQWAAAAAQAEAELQSGKPLAARKTLTEALAISPRRPDLFVLQGALSIAEGNAPAAAEAWRNASELDPTDPRLVALVALATAKSAPEDQLGAPFGLLATLDPRFADHRQDRTRLSQATLQVVWEELRRMSSPAARAIEGVLRYHDDQRRAADQALAGLDAPAFVLIYQGQRALERRAWTRAQRAFSSAALTPGAGAAHLGLARVQVARGRPAAAAEHFDRASGFSSLAGTVAVERAAAIAGKAARQEQLQRIFREHASDPWLRAALVQTR